MDRDPAVAGQFYPASAKTLKTELGRLLDQDVKPKKVLAAIAPHAGYMYSGAVAGKVFASVEVPKTCIVISPNHTGMGKRAAVWPEGRWLIPTGEVLVNEALVKKLLQKEATLSQDTLAHISEHSLEVLLPFLLAREPSVTIVPITVLHLGRESCLKVGKAIADVIRDTKEDILIVVSTDMNHYEEQKRTIEKDNLAIEKVLALDADGLISTCGENRITMCGVIPTAIAMVACKELGAKHATLIAHATSGDTSGDYNAVVGYAGFIII